MVELRKRKDEDGATDGKERGGKADLRAERMTGRARDSEREPQQEGGEG